jgi:hypothetical protein
MQAITLEIGLLRSVPIQVPAKVIKIRSPIAEIIIAATKVAIKIPSIMVAISPF